MKPVAMTSRDNFCVAFIGHEKFADGGKEEVALAIHRHLKLEDSRDVQVFDLESGRPVLLNTQGSEADVRARYQADTATRSSDSSSKSPLGRPRLGVVGKEVTLLDRHWQWLENQSGSASAVLRRLVEQARKASKPQDLIRRSQDRTHRFLSSMAGNFPGFEEAMRALYAADEMSFNAQIMDWPNDIVAIARQFGQDAFGKIK